MQTEEKNMYFNFTKSIVYGFDEFVTNVEKHGGKIGDVELRQKLKHISRTLQTIFNKWENTPDKKYTSLTKDVVYNANENKTDVLTKSKSLDDFESFIATTVGDKEAVPKVTIAEVTSTSVSSEFSILDITTKQSKKKCEISEYPPSCNNGTQLTWKEAEIVRKFGVENVKEEWIRGSKGFYVVESNSGSWKCHPCKKEALSAANILTHVSGRGHIRNIDIYNRESSETKLKNINTSLNSDLSLCDAEPKLVKKLCDADIIVPFSGYYCNACHGTLNTEEDIKLHVNGGKHRKNCES